MSRRPVARTTVRDALDSAVIALEAAGVDTPRLEGDGKLVRTMRFANLEELEAGRTALEHAIRAWCDWKAGR